MIESILDDFHHYDPHYLFLNYFDRLMWVFMGIPAWDDGANARLLWWSQGSRDSIGEERLRLEYQEQGM